MKRVGAVQEQVRSVLHAAPVASAYRGALTAALQCPGAILSGTARASWARIVMTCCVAAGGSPAAALSAAAAAEVFMTSLDLFDDAEDGEPTALDAAFGRARVLNIATGLLLLAQYGLQDTIGNRSAAGRILIEAGLHACSGQDGDLTGIQPGDMDRALEIAGAKSATLVAALCRLGACRAGADVDLQDRFALFGWRLGMAKQVLNDIAALHPDARDKTDVALGRPTLPLAVAAFLAESPTPAGADSLSTGEPVYVAWVVAANYRQAALDLAHELAATEEMRAALAALVPHC